MRVFFNPQLLRSEQNNIWLRGFVIFNQFLISPVGRLCYVLNIFLFFYNL